MIITFKKACTVCGGSGYRLLPGMRRVTFKRCTHCGGKGVRFKAVTIPKELAA